MAAAVPKCFYYQHDHWTGSVVQGQPPELWHWDGRYFFDKAKAVGGVYCRTSASAAWRSTRASFPASRCSSGRTSARAAAARGS